MAKRVFQSEFEINSSPKTLYYYLNSASGLEEWFADHVAVIDDKKYRIEIDGVSNLANIIAQKPNKFVKFEFDDDKEDPSTLELNLNVSEITNTVYLEISEYTDNYDSDVEHEEVWEGMLDRLKEIVGG